MILTYNQNGSSRGVANIIFSKPETAAKAAKDLNGLLVDGKPMKVSWNMRVFYDLPLILTLWAFVLGTAHPHTHLLGGVGYFVFFTALAPLFFLLFFVFLLGIKAKTRGRSK